MSRMRKALDGPKMYINCAICGKYAIEDVCRRCRSSLDNPRVLELDLLEHDAFYGKFFSKLGMRSQEIMVLFCDENKELNHSDFDKAIQRMFLDQDEKPRMWQVMQDILIAANNQAKEKGKLNEKSNRE